MAITEKTYSTRLVLAALLAAATVCAGVVVFLSKGIPENSSDSLHYAITDFKFAFGSGIPLSDHMRVDQFENGYALLSSGPVSINADQQRGLGYHWQPPQMPQEAAFFWRRSDAPQTVLRAEITVAGSQLIDLSTSPVWKGEIIEFGFLLAGNNGAAIEVGDVSFIPDNLDTRLQLTWRAWVTFEEWSQQSINFLHGGDYRQIISLPLLVFVWLSLSLLLFWLATRFGQSISSRQMLTTVGMLFLLAWVLLDIRWTSNNLRQIQLASQNQWGMDEQHRSSTTLDGDLYQYIQRLKSDVLADQPARILLIGDKNTVDYYLLRAKYHLLPHSVNVTGSLRGGASPKSLQYVIYFSQSADISDTEGWHQGWGKRLQLIDQDEWGSVYQVK